MSTPPNSSIPSPLGWVVGSGSQAVCDFVDRGGGVANVVFVEVFVQAPYDDGYSMPVLRRERVLGRSCIRGLLRRGERGIRCFHRCVFRSDNSRA